MSIVSNFSKNVFILDPGYNLTLRPMQYPDFYEMYKTGIKNNWTVEEIDFSTDISDLDNKISESERHLISRLIAFFATGDNIVANNLVLNLYNHINSPEARMYLSRQLFEEALHIQFYLTLLDNYVPDVSQREEMFRAVETIPSIRKKAEFCFKWMDSIYDLREIRSDADAQKFILNLACFATCIEGLFFFGAFAYVYYLKSKGLFHGLATGTNWSLRDETCHVLFALKVLETVKLQRPDLFTPSLYSQMEQMLQEAVECEYQFAIDALDQGVTGLSLHDMRQYLEYVANQRREQLGLEVKTKVLNPFPFMELQDLQELTNFFERRVAAYQVAVSGDVRFDADF